MLHKTLEAKATITEQGQFSAIAAAWSVDRGNERIIPGAFKGTIERWQESGKQIPLHWDHSGSAEDIIGTVDPMSLKETSDGLEVSGKLDLENSEVARQAWRAMKSNSLGLSFGYMVTSGQKAEDGVYELKAVDLFEISITPAPMNPDTRFMDFKSVKAPPTAEELRKESDEMERQRQAEKLEGIPEPEPEPEEPDPVETITAGLTDLGLRLTAIEESMKAEATAEELRHASAKVERELQAEKLEGIPEVEAEEVPNPFAVISERLDAIENALETSQDVTVEDEPDKEPSEAKPRSQDTLRQSSLATALEIISDGASLRKYEPESPPLPPEPPPEPEQWKRWIEAQL